MTDTIIQITVEDLKKMLAESFLSDELKNTYIGVLPVMNDEEKIQLVRIIEEGNNAKSVYEAERLDKLAHLNTALEKHLKDALREEGKYIRDQFEQADGKEEKDELNNLEQQINTL